MEFVHQPASSYRLGDFLTTNLTKPWTHLRAAVAFVKTSGTRHVVGPLTAFARNAQVEIIAGVDHCGTSFEGLKDLLDAVSPEDKVIVFHNPLRFTFHPKIYLFKSSTAADLIIGSGNLTQGGLYTNYEAAVRMRLDLSVTADASVLASVETVLNTWADLNAGTALLLNDLLLSRLTAVGLVPLEAQTADEHDPVPSPSIGEGYSPVSLPFTPRPEPAAPTPSPHMTSRRLATEGASGTAPPAIGFLMTLQRTDVGVGQTTAGTSKRSPEIFIPLVARNANPGFWNWPDGFESDPNNPAKLDRRDVPMRLGGRLIHVNMMHWPAKHDFRLRSEALRSAGNIGDILRLEEMPSEANCEYYAEVIPQDTIHHTRYDALCRHTVRNSQKRYGYY